MAPSCWNHRGPFFVDQVLSKYAKHLNISLGVDCHRTLVVVLEQEWSSDYDAMFGDGDLCSALDRVFFLLIEAYSPDFCTQRLMLGLEQ